MAYTATVKHSNILTYFWALGKSLNGEALETFTCVQSKIY